MQSNQVDYISEKTMNLPQKRSNVLLGSGLALLLASAAFFSGLQIGTDSGGNKNLEAGLFSLFASTPQEAEGADLTEFWRVWHLLEEKYVSSTTTEPLSVEDRVHGAITGLVSSYDDPYTVFLPPADAEQFQENISGKFGGVGMEVGMRNGLVTIITPLADTPAERAGIVAGDIIIEIDTVSTEGMSIDGAVDVIRGEIGTEVLLKIFREGEIEFI